MKILMYCTKCRPYLTIADVMHNDQNYHTEYATLFNYSKEDAIRCFGDLYNGKIVAECDFEVSKIELHSAYYNYGPAYFTKRQNSFKYFSYTDLLSASCMRDNEMFKYLGNKGGYAIHIRNLHIFDEPKELSDYYSIHDVDGMLLTDKLKKAPQNIQRISLHEWEYGTYNSEDMAILIPIHSEHLCKILNDECSIIVKKKILRGMI